MKALILAGGYGTRLQRDIESDTSGKFDHLSGVPKPLLPIGGVPLSTHLMSMLERYSDRIDQVLLVCNQVYHDQFVRWAAEWPSLKVVCDGSTSNEVILALSSERSNCFFSYRIYRMIMEDDNLFYEDFNLGEFLDGFSKVREKAAGYTTTVGCSDEDTWKRGIVEVDQDRCITSFLEKVGPEKTQSRLSVPCFYIFSKQALPLIDKFLDEKKDLPLSERDAPGHFLKYLCEREPVYTFQVSGRFDVGSLETYRTCNEHFTDRRTQQQNDGDDKS